MRATAVPEEGNTVRLTVEVDADEVDAALNQTVRSLARQLRVPGFRPGKAPRRVIEARLGGPAALRQEAIREALPELYGRAIAEADIDPLDSPEIDITSGEDAGPLAFDAIVPIRPTVNVAGYGGLVVTVPTLEASEEDIARQIDRLREHDGELVAVSREVADGDYVTIDVNGTRGESSADGDAADPDLSAQDYLYEVGTGAVVAELDEQLRGASSGDTLTFEAEVPGVEGSVSFTVAVKEVKEKNLPEPTDEWVSESSEFSTLTELRADLSDRIRRVKVAQAQMALRDGTLDALVALVAEDVPDALVDRELQQNVRELEGRLARQGIGIEQYLSVSGQTPDQFLEELRPAALKAAKADLALRAVAEAEGIDATAEDIDAELQGLASQMNEKPTVIRERLERNGGLGAVRSEKRKAKALAWLVEHVSLVDEEGGPVDRGDLEIKAIGEAADTSKEEGSGQ